MNNDPLVRFSFRATTNPTEKQQAASDGFDREQEEQDSYDYHNEQEAERLATQPAEPVVKHSPSRELPWKSQPYGKQVLLTDAGEFPIAKFYSQSEADIVLQAVNLHKELVAALRSINGWSKCQCESKHGDNPNCCVLVAEAALRKVR